MNGKEKEEILVALARLEERYDNLERYIYKELKPDVSRLFNQMHTTFRWVGSIILFINGVLGLIGVLILKGVL